MDKSNVITGYAPSKGAKLYFEVCGDGPALVFIHAGVSDHRMWAPQVDAFASKFKVMRYDLRGFGKSTMPQEKFALRDDLLALLRHLGITKAALVGCSMGGATAIDFTLEHPEMVSALVPVGAGVSGWDDWSQESVDLFSAATNLVKKGDADGAFELSVRCWIRWTLARGLPSRPQLSGACSSVAQGEFLARAFSASGRGAQSSSHQATP